MGTKSSVLILCIAATLGLSGCSSAAEVKTTEASGVLYDSVSTLTVGLGHTKEGDSCGGENVSPSKQVSIQNAKGDQLGFTTIDEGELTLGGADKFSMRSARCVFEFTVDGIPLGQGPYQVSIDGLGTQQVDESGLSAIELTVR